MTFLALLQQVQKALEIALYQAFRGISINCFSSSFLYIALKRVKRAKNGAKKLYIYRRNTTKKCRLDAINACVARLQIPKKACFYFQVMYNKDKSKNKQ